VKRGFVEFFKNTVDLFGQRQPRLSLHVQGSTPENPSALKLNPPNYSAATCEMRSRKKCRRICPFGQVTVLIVFPEQRRVLSSYPPASDEKFGGSNNHNFPPVPTIMRRTGIPDETDGCAPDAGTTVFRVVAGRVAKSEYVGMVVAVRKFPRLKSLFPTIRSTPDSCEK